MSFLSLLDNAPGKDGIGDDLDVLLIVAEAVASGGKERDSRNALAIESAVDRIKDRLRDVMDHCNPRIKAARQ